MPQESLKIKLCAAITLATHEESDRAIPQDLLDSLGSKEIPSDYLPLIADGAPSELWSRLAVMRMYPANKERALGLSPELLTRA